MKNSSILEVAKTKQTKGEDQQAFLTRVVEALAEAPQEDLDQLDAASAKWMADATNAYNADQAIPDLPTGKKSKAAKGEKWEEVEPEAAPKKSKKAKAAAAEAEPEAAPKKSKKSKAAVAEAEDEPEAAPKKSKKAKAAGTNEGRGQGMLLAARKAVIENPDMSSEDIAAQIHQQTGAELSLSTARAVRYHTRQALIALGSLGYTMTSKRGKAYAWPA